MITMQVRSIVTIGIVLALCIVALADWQEWIGAPDLLSSDAKVDRFTIVGDAPFCLLGSPLSDLAQCHYLSIDHCVLSNTELIKPNIAPADRAVCVPNPLSD